MNVKELVQQKLINEEECAACVMCHVVDAGNKHVRICAVVKGKGEHGVFFYKVGVSQPQKVSDLIFDFAIPVSDTFKFQHVTQGLSSDGQTLLTVKITAETTCTYLEVVESSSTKSFLNSLKLAIQVQSQNADLCGLPSTFGWIDKYRNPTPMHDDMFDLRQSADEWAINMLAQQSLGETCPVVKDDNISLHNNKLNLEIPSPLPSQSSFSTTNSQSSLRSVNSSELSHPSVKTKTRDNIIKLVMKSKEDEYTERRTLRVFCGTWNVNGRAATESLEPWLSPPHDTDPPDIYAVGFQELDLSKNAMIFTESPKEEEWYNQVEAALHPKAKYHKVRLERLVGMMIVVFARQGVEVRNVQSSHVGTGLMGMMGNKGGVGVRFDVYNTSLCFVNTHLAAHTEEYERRNQDFREISNRMVFVGRRGPLSMSDHDIVYWIGDLNYRLTSDLDVDRCKKMIAENKLSELMNYDQLVQQISRKKAFMDYIEGKITFIPTYKYDTGTDNWDSSEKSRCPAWCDRVLWRGAGVRQLAYRSHPALTLSDHKPVSATFDTQVRVINKALYRKVYEDTMKELDRLENDFLPQVELSTREVVFKDVKFTEPQIETISVTNTGQVPVQFEFINKLNDKEYCKPWLLIQPSKAVVNVDASLDIQLEVFVNRFTAPALNSADDSIEDILIMHLEGGKDLFITVSGNYLPSCFGSSIDALVQMFTPIRDVETATLIDLEHGEVPSSASVERPLDIPKEVWRLVDHLYRNGLEQPDLFLQPGLQSEIQQIRDCLDTGRPSSIPGTIYSVAEVLLLFLESTMEPVIPFAFYDKCIEASSNPLQCKQVLSQVPASHRKLFEYICAFLRKCLLFAHKNNLTGENLAQLFGSILLRPPPGAGQRRRGSGDDRAAAAFVQHFIAHVAS